MISPLHLRLTRSLMALVFFFALAAACSICQEEIRGSGSVRANAPTQTDSPIAGIARMIPGEWQVTAQSGKSMYHTWHWGPGKHSMRRMTDGLDAGGNPWYELRVVYWHPHFKQVRLLGLTPFAKGVMEGAVKLEKDTAEALFDLYQTGGLRKMALNWRFEGPDKFHERLLESTGPAGYSLLVEWDQVRKAPTPARPRIIEETSNLAAPFKSLEPLRGHIWEAKGNGTTGGILQTQTTLESIPLNDAVYVRVLGPPQEGGPAHFLDAYLYYHTGFKTVRCLALSNHGAVYEGPMTVMKDGALQLDLTGYEGDRAVPYVARFSFENDGALRQQIWSVKDKERTLVLDLLHKKGDKKKN